MDAELQTAKTTYIGAWFVVRYFNFVLFGTLSKLAICEVNAPWSWVKLFSITECWKTVYSWYVKSDKRRMKKSLLPWRERNVQNVDVEFLIAISTVAY